MSEQLNNQLIGELLALPYEQRQELADRLVESLHPPGEEISPEDWKAAWLPEWQRRIAAAESGEEPCLPLEQVWPDIAGHA